MLKRSLGKRGGEHICMSLQSLVPVYILGTGMITVVVKTEWSTGWTHSSFEIGMDVPPNSPWHCLNVSYRKFYQWSEPRTLRQLYVSLIRPHLEYAAPVWDPYLSKDIQ